MMRFLKQTPTNSDAEQSDGLSESSENAVTYTYEELKKSMEEAQKKHFGYKNLKDFQIEAVQATFHKKDSFLVMATGMGKSLCYQIPSIMKEAKKKFTIVISPLISLMKDQVDNLNRKQINAVYLGSGQKGNTNNILTQIKHGVYNMIYCSPEYALNNKNLFSMLRKRILLIAIDEVHCMSEWGHDFRPAYRKLNELKKIVSGIPIMCLTATCTKNVQDDILKNLQFDLKTCLIKRSSVNKKNLFYSVKIKTEIYKDLKNILDIPAKATLTRTKQFVDNSKICPYNSTLIYVNSKKECEEIHEFLKSKGLLVGMYHADMSNNDKMTVHEQFLKDEIQIVVATVAFGMGIDKPDIRRIIHYGFSRSLEGYVQQVGRGGRDNGDAEAILFFNMVDESKTKNIIIRENMANKQIVTNFERVQHIINMFTDASDYAYSSICRRKKIYEYFDEQPKETDNIHIFDDESMKGICYFVRQWNTYLCAKCDNCVSYMNIMKQKEKQEQEQVPNNKGNKTTTHTKVGESISTNGVEELEDFSNELQALLKCISALRGRTGTSTIQKILTRSKESSIIKKNYHELDVYGKGSHKSAQWWSAFIKLARNDKYIKETLNCGNDMGYVSIGLTEKGEEFLKKKEKTYMVNIPACLTDLLGKVDKSKGVMKKKEIEKERPRFNYIEDAYDKRTDDMFMKNKKETINFTEFSFTKTNSNINFSKQENTCSFSTNRYTNNDGININELNLKKTNKENRETVDKYQYFNADKKEMTKKEETVKKLTNAEINEKIMSILIRTRMLEARKQNIPPFQLISDQPLKDICHMRLSTVQLIRKHVDNISPICPNSFLEKLVQGIRGFCLLYEIETDINIKKNNQNNYNTCFTSTVKESSVNKFDNLISSLAYGNAKTEERHFNKSVGNYNHESLKSGITKDTSVAHNDSQNITTKFNPAYNKSCNESHNTNYTNNGRNMHVKNSSYNQGNNYTCHEQIHAPNEVSKSTTFDFTSFNSKSNEPVSKNTNLYYNTYDKRNENNRNINDKCYNNSESNSINNTQNYYNSNDNRSNNMSVSNNMNNNINYANSFEQSRHNNEDVRTKRDFTSTVSMKHSSFQASTIQAPTIQASTIQAPTIQAPSFQAPTSYNPDSFNQINLQNSHSHANNIHKSNYDGNMFSKTPHDNSEVNNFDTNDDDFFNSFKMNPIVQSGNEQLTEKKNNLSFFDNFIYDKNKTVTNESDIFADSLNMKHVEFREIKKRRKY